jgi:PAS domain S-box-containing protein
VPGVLYDYVLHADGTDQFLWVSARSRELLGIAPEALERDSGVLWGRVPDEDRPALVAAVQAAYRADAELDVEFRIRRPGGGLRWLQARSMPHSLPRVRERVWSGFLMDVTERRRALEALDQERASFRSLIEHSLDLVFRFDTAGRVRYVNAALRASGLSPEQAVGKTAEELGLVGATPAWGDALARACAGEVAKCELTAVGAHGPRHFEALLIPEPGDGGVASVLAVARDVTDRVQAEEAVREADRRKSEFLAMLSHELRNPLAPIRNALFILGRAAPGGEQAGRALAVIDRQIGQLAHLVDDLLDLTRIERNRMLLQRQRLELNELVRRTAEDHRSTFDTAGVELAIRTGPEALFVEGDPARLAQVVANLLHNAAKFTPRGGSATVEVARADGQRARIRVSDTGMGMTPETLARVFQPFAQEDSGLARAKGGLGLGLALVKGLVDSHGGEVAAASEGPGRGATLEVLLPLGEQTAVAAAGRGEGPRRRRRILIVEDNVDAATTLREVLELEGHAVSVAHGGHEGVARVREERPEIVLCDIGLPGMDGYEVARRIRSDPALRDVHLVAVSGYALPEDVQRATSAGFELHLSKPPSLDRLEQAIEAIR